MLGIVLAGVTAACGPAVGAQATIVPLAAGTAIPAALPLPPGVLPASATSGVDQGLAFVSFSSGQPPADALAAYEGQLRAAGFTFTGVAGAWRGYVSGDLAIEVMVATNGPPTRITVRYDREDPHHPPGQTKVLTSDGPRPSVTLPDPPNAGLGNRPSVPPGQAAASDKPAPAGASGSAGATGANGGGGANGNGNGNQGGNGNGNGGANGNGNGGANGNGNQGGNGNGNQGGNGNGNAASTSVPSAPPSATPNAN